MRVSRILLGFSVLALLAPSFAEAQESSTNEAIASGGAEVQRNAPQPQPTQTQAETALTQAAQLETTQPKTALPALPSELAISDPKTRQAYLDAMQRYYKYRLDGYEFRSQVFEWQLYSSIVIFAIVVLLVIAGIYFAAVQFHVALAAARAMPEALNTKFELSAKGVVVNSSVLGVIILSLSLAFFYLYLVHVYPIRDAL